MKNLSTNLDKCKCTLQEGNKKISEFHLLNTDKKISQRYKLKVHRYKMKVHKKISRHHQEDRWFMASSGHLRKMKDHPLQRGWIHLPNFQEISFPGWPEPEILSSTFTGATPEGSPPLTLGTFGLWVTLIDFFNKTLLVIINSFKVQVNGLGLRLQGEQSSRAARGLCLTLALLKRML